MLRIFLLQFQPAVIPAETGLGVVDGAGVAAVTKELGVLYEL